MTRCNVYTLTILAACASCGGAFRHNLASVMEHQFSKYGTVFEAEPPNVDVMMQHTQTVIDAKIAAADASLAHAQKKMMNLSTAEMVNNTQKGVLMHEAVDMMMAANVAKAKANEVHAKVELMVEACHILFKAVQAFKNNAEPQAALTRKTTKEELESKIEALKADTVETERLDLEGLLALIAQIRAAEAKVKTLDAAVGAGAAEGIVGATALVYTYADQLTVRQTSLTSADAFAEFAPLQPADAKLLIDPKTKASLKAASTKIEQIIAAKTQIVADANAKMLQIHTSGSTDVANYTAMHGLVDDLFKANQAKAQAEQLALAIDKAIAEIENFFELFADYKATQAEKRAIAKGEVDELIKDANKLLKATEAAVLSAAGTFFHLYQMMWVHTSEAEASMPDDDEDYATIRSSLDENSIAVHIWLNEELETLCTHYGSCTAAKAKLIEILENKPNGLWCDERSGAGKVACIDTNGGHQPNGKVCKWIKPNPELGLTGDCKQVNPPTKNLKYGKDPKGIFY